MLPKCDVGWWSDESRQREKLSKKGETMCAVISQQILDQYQYLGNCPPTPPLTQQQSIDNKLGLMLG